MSQHLPELTFSQFGKLDVNHGILCSSMIVHFFPATSGRARWYAELLQRAYPPCLFLDKLHGYEKKSYQIWPLSVQLYSITHMEWTGLLYYIHIDLHWMLSKCWQERFVYCHVSIAITGKCGLAYVKSSLLSKLIVVLTLSSSIKNLNVSCLAINLSCLLWAEWFVSLQS